MLSEFGCDSISFIDARKSACEQAALPNESTGAPNLAQSGPISPSSTIHNRTYALHDAGIILGSFTFEVIGGSLRMPSSRRRSKSSEIFA